MTRAMLIGLLACLSSLSPPAEGAQPVTGWLGEGTGVYHVRPVPTGWSASAPGGWSATMPTWSNASPVVVGDRVVVTSEPLSVICVSLTSGEELWRHEVSYLDTVGPDERAKITKERAEAQAIAA